MFREDLSRNFGFILNDVARLMRTAFDRRVKALGLTRSQWWVLNHLFRNDGATQSELADILEVEKATLGRLLDRMEQKGWVRREEPCRRSPCQARVPDEGSGAGASRRCARRRRKLRRDALGRVCRPRSRNSSSTRCSPSRRNLSRPENGGNGSRKPKALTWPPMSSRAVVVVHRAVRILLLVVVPLIAVVVGLYVYATGGREVETDNAYVKVNMVPISAAITGRVIEVVVHENQTVERGDVLFRLDPVPHQIAVDGARAQMDVVRTDGAVAAGRVPRHAAGSGGGPQSHRLPREAARAAGIPQGKGHDARRLLRRGAPQRRGRQAAASTAFANAPTAWWRNCPAIPNTPVERLPRYVEARAAYDAAMLDLSRTTIKAPYAGVVSNMKLQVGEYVEKGAPMFSLIESGSLWIEANYKETQLTYMEVGQPAKVVADAYPDQEWSATRRYHRLRHRCGIRRAAAAERHRQLGEGRAAHTGAHQGRAACRQAAAARGHDGHGHGRYRPAARLAARGEETGRRRLAAAVPRTVHCHRGHQPLA